MHAFIFSSNNSIIPIILILAWLCQNFQQFQLILVVKWSIVVMTRQIFTIMVCQISPDFIFFPVIHFLIFYLLFFVFYSKLKLLYSSSVNLILAKFFKNTCLKFGNHYYAVFASDITSSYYFFNYIFFLHFHKEEFCTFI